MQIDAHDIHAYETAKQNQRDTNADDITAFSSQAHQAYDQDDDDGFDQAGHKLMDRILNYLGLIAYLMQLKA